MIESFSNQGSTRERSESKKTRFDSASSLEELRDIVSGSAQEIKSYDGKKIDADALSKNMALVEAYASEGQLAELAQKFDSFNDVPELKKKVVELANAKVLNVCKRNQFMNLESLEDMEKLFMHLRFTGVPSGFEADGFSGDKIGSYIQAIGSVIETPVALNPSLKVFEGNEDLQRQVLDLLAKQSMN